jgi:hypothetical protein
VLKSPLYNLASVRAKSVVPLLYQTCVKSKFAAAKTLAFVNLTSAHSACTVNFKALFLIFGFATATCSTLTNPSAI